MGKKNATINTIYGIEASLLLATLLMHHLTHNGWVMVFGLLMMVGWWVWWWKKMARVLRPFVEDIPVREVVGPARDEAAIRLLRNDPADYFSRPLNEIKDLDS